MDSSWQQGPLRDGVVIHEKIGVDASRARTLKGDRASIVAAALNQNTSTTLFSDDAALPNRCSGVFETPRASFGLLTSYPRGSPEERSSRARR